MQPATNLLITATRKALKFLQRDFLELELIQGSNRGLGKFCDNSYSRTKTLLHEELYKYYKSIFFMGETINPSSDTTILVQPIDGINNFARSIPFFAVMITCLKKINNVFTPTNCIMSFPALDEIYYAEKGAGAWVDKGNTYSSNNKANRLRVSGGISSIEEAIIAGNNIDRCLAISKNIRYTGSICYDMSLFAAGKIDVIYFDGLNPIVAPGFELFVREMGGIIISSERSFICSNPGLADRLRQ